MTTLCGAKSKIRLSLWIRKRVSRIKDQEAKAKGPTVLPNTNYVAAAGSWWKEWEEEEEEEDYE